MKRHEGKSPGKPETSPSMGDRPGGDGPSSSLAADAFELNREGMLITDGDFNVLHANQALTEITGYTLAETIGKKPGFLDSGTHNEDPFQDMWASLADWGYWQGEVWDRRKNGAVFPAWLSVSKVLEGNSVRHYVVGLSDITERKRTEARTEYLRLHDALTGLPAKDVFLDRLSWAVASARRRRQRLGVLALSLDLPQPMGQDAWDLVLKQAASRLLNAVRESDAVARFDGEELVVLMEEISSVQHAEWVARKVLWTLRQPFTAIDRETRMDASIGIALFPQHDGGAAGLVSKAQRAMNQVRSSNRNTFQIFNQQLFSAIG